MGKSPRLIMRERGSEFTRTGGLSKSVPLDEFLEISTGAKRIHVGVLVDVADERRLLEEST
jgi:hypothetical protein